jgi:hypothetical protein
MEKETMQEELVALEVQNKGLQLLVGELLVTNQELRLALERRPPIKEVAEKVRMTGGDGFGTSLRG